MLANGMARNDEGVEYYICPMVNSLRDIGKIIRHLGTVESYTMAGICTKDSGTTLWQMVEVYICMLMERSIRDCGLMISNMVEELKPGPIMLDTKATTKMDKNTDTVAFSGLMVVHTQVSSRTMT